MRHRAARLGVVGVLAATMAGAVVAVATAAPQPQVPRDEATAAVSATSGAATPSAPTPSATTPPAPRLDPRCTQGRVVCVSTTDRELRLVVQGRVVLALAARFGGTSTPTRHGVFTVTRKERVHWSSTYGDEMPYALFFSGRQAIHYSADFARVGYAGASHGCVNLRSRSGAQRLFDAVPVGTRVVVS